MPMFRKKPIHYVGLDCSGPSKVLPPTFEGIQSLVKRVGESQAMALYSADSHDETPSEGIVRDFLAEYKTADKVERQTLVREFEDFVADLEAKSKEPAGEEPAPEPQPTEPSEEGKA